MCDTREEANTPTNALPKNVPVLLDNHTAEVGFGGFLPGAFSRSAWDLFLVKWPSSKQSSGVQGCYGLQEEVRGVFSDRYALRGFLVVSNRAGLYFILFLFVELFLLGSSAAQQCSPPSVGWSCSSSRSDGWGWGRGGVLLASHAFGCCSLLVASHEAITVGFHGPRLYAVYRDDAGCCGHRHCTSWGWGADFFF